MSELLLTGIPISKGIVIGKARILDFSNESLITRNIKDYDIKIEKAKVESALLDLISDSRRIIKKYNQKEKIKSIIESEIMFLEDTELKKSIFKYINNKNNCLDAIDLFFEDYTRIFKQHENSLTRIKVNDIGFLKHKLIQKLTNKKNDYSDVKDKIIVTSLLNSDELIKIYEKGAIGFVTEFGSNLSHSSIISRSLNIPAVFGVGTNINNISNDDNLIVDGNLGDVYLKPSSENTKLFNEKLIKFKDENISSLNIKNVQIRNEQGKKLYFYSNVNNFIDIENSLLNNSDGVGLVRTENLIHHIEEILDEEYQFEIYNKIAESLYPKSVTFRLFDFGYDKLNLNDEKEFNPALGLRGIRYLLKNRNILEIQLRALLRSSSMGNVKILIPMITIQSEVVETIKTLDKLSGELNLHSPKIGAMIETPAAAFSVKEICKITNFISIGTNDLMQYFFAADRNNEHVSDFFNYKDKSFLKLLIKINKDCQTSGKELVICGQLASDETTLEYLVKNGFTNFSVVPARILTLKKLFIDN